MKKIAVIFVLFCLFCVSVYAEDPETAETLPESGASVNYAMETHVISQAETMIAVSMVDIKAPSSETLGRPSVALVLSGGGAKGIAHIGIIDALERYGIPIDKVFGTSMGALIGGLYAAGLSPAEMKEVVTSNDLMDLFTSFESTGYKEVLNAFDYNSNNVLSVSLGQGIGGVSGLIDDYMILNFLTKYIGNVPDGIDFDTDLVVPFECNAANLLTGDEVVFTGGDLITAMRSSMSIPLVFEPVTYSESAVLVDGGAVCNYIVHRARAEGYDIVIVVTLDGYRKEKRTADEMTSLSGVVGASLSLVLDNVSRGELDMADYWFSPDTTDYTTFSFSDADRILEIGYEEAENQTGLLETIASLFTEKQKVYKDPERVGEYFTRYPEKTKSEYFASRDTRHEDLLGRTRVSFGLYGKGGYGFFFGKDGEDSKRAFYPTLSLRSFIKDISGSPFSLDVRLKSTMNWSSDFSAAVLFRFTPDDIGMRIMGMARLRGSIGSLTIITDKSAEIRFNIIEGLVAVDAGLMITNERNHNIMIYASADNTWGVMNLDDEGHSYGFVPSATLEAVFYPDYSNGFFAMTGGRMDIIASAGYYVNDSKWFYKLALAGENTFRLNDVFSFWFDATAYSNHGNPILRSSFMDYGGWDGMPGYAAASLYGEFIYGGIGAQFRLSRSFASSYISCVVRGGIRSDVQYGYSGKDEFDSFVPFKDCFSSGLWDLGISVGYGFSTPVGDLIIGAGFNKNLQLALYFELT